ncbi:hypothetical protein [Euzebya tangerina]|uniref:hypothetical protein n=1 Tax=Euzebya tangerina TaxID=591198 RepID=UPI0013C2E95F|nr:hypothetical protein [Euzebya tangerina]
MSRAAAIRLALIAAAVTLVVTALLPTVHVEQPAFPPGTGAVIVGADSWNRVPQTLLATAVERLEAPLDLGPLGALLRTASAFRIPLLFGGCLVIALLVTFRLAPVDRELLDRLDDDLRYFS